MTIPMMVLIISAIALVGGAISFVFWKLWDTSRESFTQELSSRREFHNKDIDALHKRINDVWREMNDLRAHQNNLKQDTHDHDTKIAVILGTLESIKGLLSEIKHELRGKTQ